MSGQAVYFGGPSIDSIGDVTLVGAGTEYSGLGDEGFGSSVAGAGDVNGDGYSDVIIGAPTFESGSQGVGRAYLFISSSPAIVPRIAKVKDVPNDQGGQVSIHWIRSGYDARGIGKIRDYVIQRTLPPALSGFSWENIATVTATQDPRYSYTASTLYDASGATSGVFYFRVVARTSNAFELWKSAPVAGSSLDNMAPAPPANVAATLLAGRVVLRWNRNREADFDHYEVYRSSARSFDPDTLLPHATTIDTSFADENAAAQADYCYALLAVDKEGNRSAKSNEVNILATAVKESPRLPLEFALEQNYPNPFNPSTVIGFQLPVESEVSLVINNLNGQVVKQVARGKYANGKHEVMWDGRNESGFRVASGVYVYVLKAGEFVAKKRLVLMK